ncbi:unnamed protein product [Cochlearia groenlandica]
MKYLHLNLFLVTIITAIASISTAAPTTGGGALAEECNNDFQKVYLCLDFASGKAPNPSKKCCEAVEDIKERDPKCLCFVIQQAKSGGKTLRDLGVQEAKLVQLPSSCQLHNASISNCPKLLGISPSSPDAAVFTGNATSTGNSSPATPSTEKSGSSSLRDHGHVTFVALMTVLTFA